MKLLECEGEIVFCGDWYMNKNIPVVRVKTTKYL